MGEGRAFASPKRLRPRRRSEGECGSKSDVIFAPVLGSSAFDVRRWMFDVLWEKNLRGARRFREILQLCATLNHLPKGEWVRLGCMDTSWRFGAAPEFMPSSKSIRQPASRAYNGAMVRHLISSLAAPRIATEIFGKNPMEPTSLTQSPFAVLTFIVAPALLTNSSSVLALSTINRMLRTRERMNELFAKFDAGGLEESEAARLIEQVNRVEKQGVLLLRALHSIYVALGAFAAATLVTLLGAVLGPFQGAVWFRALVGLGLAMGFGGVGGLMFGSVSLFRATQLSLNNIREEAALIRERQARRTAHLTDRTANGPGANR